MLLKDLIYYIFSIVAICLFVSSVQFKKKKNILVFQLFASISYMLVYLVKGGYSGVSIEGLTAIKNTIFVKYEEDKKKIPLYLLITFIGLLISVSIVFYNGLLSLIPLLINIMLFLGTYLKNPKYLRRIVLLNGFLWMFYNLYVGAYLLIVGNILEIVSSYISIRKYKKSDK